PRRRSPNSIASLDRAAHPRSAAAEVQAVPQPVNGGLNPDPDGYGRPVKPVRFTVDLEPAEREWLRSFAARRATGATRVVRALLAELREDPQLAERIGVRMWRSQGLGPDGQPL
ncbi:MAG: hypothetical protein J2P28_23995, partial [Actinobacteria bacterium]|nr:hypothetical protein [Actinomycetota bacterium]